MKSVFVLSNASHERKEHAIRVRLLWATLGINCNFSILMTLYNSTQATQNTWWRSLSRVSAEQSTVIRGSHYLQGSEFTPLPRRGGPSHPLDLRTKLCTAWSGGHAGEARQLCILPRPVRSAAAERARQHSRGHYDMTRKFQIAITCQTKVRPRVNTGFCHVSGRGYHKINCSNPASPKSTTWGWGENVSRVFHTKQR